MGRPGKSGSGEGRTESLKKADKKYWSKRKRAGYRQTKLIVHENVIKAYEGVVAEDPGPYSRNREMVAALERSAERIDPNLRKEIIRTLKGQCELCESAAPFKGSDGLPYLEMHPLTALSEGGELSYENLVGLCPNCHARLHDLREDEDIARLAKKLSARIKRRN